MKLKATIANLRLFNQSVFRDVTISFPTSKEMIQSALRKISIDGRENTEILITAYETDINGLASRLSEYENIDELNYLQHGEYSNNVQDLINLTYNLDCFTLHPGVTDAETYGRLLLDEIEDVDIPAIVKPYIDYEAYGEDARINEGGEFTAFGYIVNNHSSFQHVYDGFSIPKEYAVFSYPFREFHPRLKEASA